MTRRRCGSRRPGWFLAQRGDGTLVLDCWNENVRPVEGATPAELRLKAAAAGFEGWEEAVDDLEKNIWRTGAKSWGR